MKPLSIALLALCVSACGKSPETKMFTSVSPNGRYAAELFHQEEGTLGSTRYRLDIVKADSGKRETVFRGVNAWVETPEWRGTSSLVLPFCFGQISSVTSVIAADGGSEVTFRSSSSSNIRLHIITSPDTKIGDVLYCSSEQASP